MSYAEIASKGPKQSREEAAAPQPPQVDSSEAASTSSLVDVDGPSVRTVPSDFAEQDVQTSTQALRRDREDEEAAARAEADLARKQKKAAAAAAASRARRADDWITRQLAGLSDSAGQTIIAGNWVVVAALSGWLGYKAWALHERGRLGWSNVGLGLGVLGTVGAFGGIFANYFEKAKSKKQ